MLGGSYPPIVGFARNLHVFQKLRQLLQQECLGGPSTSWSSGGNLDGCVVFEHVRARRNLVDSLLEEGDVVLPENVAEGLHAGLDADIEARDQVVVNEVSLGARETD